MSYLEMQKSEMKKAQVEECLRRLKMLDLHPNVAKEFCEEGKLNLSQGAILFWLNDEEKQMVKEWEEKTGNMVYHIIKGYYVFGTCYSFLYVSDEPGEDTEEWEWDREDLENGCPLVYVKNVTDSLCSEYGSICIESRYGGLLRTA